MSFDRNINLLGALYGQADAAADQLGFQIQSSRFLWELNHARAQHNIFGYERQWLEDHSFNLFTHALFNAFIDPSSEIGKDYTGFLTIVRETGFSPSGDASKGTDLRSTYEQNIETFSILLEQVDIAPTSDQAFEGIEAPRDLAELYSFDASLRIVFFLKDDDSDEAEQVRTGSFFQLFCGRFGRRTKAAAY